MSELVRRALEALPRLTGASAPEPQSAASPRRIRVGVSAAANVLDLCGSAAMTAVRHGVGALCRDLGLDAEVEVVPATVPGDSHVAVSVAGRPVTLLPSDAIAASRLPADMLYRHVVEGTLRRLPLLLDPKALPGVASYLVAVGCAPPSSESDTGPDVETAEELIAARNNDEIVIELPAHTLRRVGDGGARAVAHLRETEFRKRGIRYPDVRIEVVDHEPGIVRLRLNDVTLPTCELGADADWGIVVQHLGRELQVRRHWFIRADDVRRVLEHDLRYLFPQLVAATVGAYSLAEITACLRELLRSERRIRNLPRIAWLMLEQGDAIGASDVLRLSESPLTPTGRRRSGGGRDPVVLAARVRKIAAEETWRLGNFRPLSRAYRLPAALEERLVAEVQRGQAGRAEWEVVRVLTAEPGVERVVTHTIEAIGPVRDAVQALDRPPRVVASQELPPDVDLGLFPIVGEGGPRSGNRGRHLPALRRGGEPKHRDLPRRHEQ